MSYDDFGRRAPKQRRVANEVMTSRTTDYQHHHELYRCRSMGISGPPALVPNGVRVQDQRFEYSNTVATGTLDHLFDWQYQCASGYLPAAFQRSASATKAQPPSRSEDLEHLPGQDPQLNRLLPEGSRPEIIDASAQDVVIVNDEESQTVCFGMASQIPSSAFLQS
jgi:hypothetical protein